MIEATVERAFCREAKARDILHPKFTPDGQAGWNDRLLLATDRPAEFVELKRPGEKPRALQRKRHRELRARGFRVTVVASLEDVDVFWTDWDARAP